MSPAISPLTELLFVRAAGGRASLSEAGDEWVWVCLEVGGEVIGGRHSTQPGAPSPSPHPLDAICSVSGSVSPQEVEEGALVFFFVVTLHS